MTTTALDMVPPGTRCRVIALDVGYGINRRLMQMGLVPGSEVKVLDNSGRGPLVIEVRGVEIALSRGIAKKILVEVLK